nr:BID domain-containing protein [Brucella anthropi]
MGRSGAKTTTLDFGDEAGYRSVVDGFAERRGIETLTSIVPSFAAFVERQSAWIAEKREQLTALWSRVEKVFSRTTEQEIVAGEAATEKATLQTPPAETSRPVQEQANQLSTAPSASPTVAADAVATEQATRPPLFAAVTSFADTVEEAARAATRQSEGYRNQIDQLIAVAPRIWQDPEAAVAKIERSIATITERGKLAEVLDQDPGRAGALRGSDRLIDRFSATGAERKAALQAVPVALAAIRKSETVYRTALERQLVVEQSRRGSMLVEVPALSEAAEASVRSIGQIADRKQRDYAVLQLAPEIKTELREFTNTLEKRFGPKAFEHPDPKLIANVAHSEKARFNEIAKQMQTVRQVVNTDIEQRFLAERMQKSLSRNTGITH